MKEIQSKKRNFSVYALVIGIGLALYSLVLIVILLWAVVNSFKTDMDFMTHPASWPEVWDFKYIDVFFAYTVTPEVDGKLGTPLFLDEMLINSLILSIGAATVSTVSPLIMAYVSTKYPFSFSKFIPQIVLFVMVVPVVGTTASTLQIVRGLNLYDTYLGVLALKAGFTSMYFLVFAAAFRTLSWEYAEAAFMDGASHARVMFTIMFPLVKTIIWSVWLIFFIQYWNDYQITLTYYKSMPTAAYAMYRLKLDSDTSASTPMLLTSCIIVIVPVLILFLIFKNKIMGNLTVGGIKG